MYAIENPARKVPKTCWLVPVGNIAVGVFVARKHREIAALAQSRSTWRRRRSESAKKM